MGRENFAFVYSSKLGERAHSFGTEHPFMILRYGLTYELLAELGLLCGPGIRQVEGSFAPEEALGGFHRQDYLDILREFSREDIPRANFLYGLGDVENPVFKGLYDWARLVCGGTLEAVRLVTEERYRAAFHMAGGIRRQGRPVRIPGRSPARPSALGAPG